MIWLVTKLWKIYHLKLVWSLNYPPKTSQDSKTVCSPYFLHQTLKLFFLHGNFCHFHDILQLWIRPRLYEHSQNIIFKVSVFQCQEVFLWRSRKSIQIQFKVGHPCHKHKGILYQTFSIQVSIKTLKISYKIIRITKWRKKINPRKS